MGETDPDAEAARALGAIRRARGRAVGRMLVPRWFWWVLGAGVVAVGAIADAGNGGATAGVALVFAILVVALSFSLIVGLPRGARVSSAALGARGAASIVAFVFAAVVLPLATAFALRAAGFPAPGTIGTLFGAAILVIVGPRLMRRLDRELLRERET